MRVSQASNQSAVTSLDTAAQLYMPRSLKLPGKREQKRNRKRGDDKRKTKIVLAHLLRVAGYADKAEDVLRCRSKYGVLTCGRHVARKIPTFRCRFPLCPDCAVERSGRAQGRLQPRLRQLLAELPHDRLVFITLTVRNNFDSLADNHKRFREAFRRLRRQSRWSHKIRGGIASFEVAGTECSGWHYHAHILAFRRAYYDQADLTDDWQQATLGEGYIVDIREVNDVNEATQEVLKYVFKPADLNEWSPAMVKEFMQMKGARFSSVFGNLYGVKVQEEADADTEADAAKLEDGSPCPECGDPLFNVTLTAEELDELGAGAWITNKHGTVH